jgi:antitoxin MazE
MSGKISRWGNSVAVRIPKEVLEQAGLREGQSVDFSTRDGVVEVRKRSQSIEELFAEYEEKYGPLEPPEMVDWGPDVGTEILPADDWSDIAPKGKFPETVDAKDRRHRSRRR